MQDYRIVPMKPTGEALSTLRRSAGWRVLGEADSQRGVDGSLFAVCAFSGDELVGTARVIGDGRAAFYIQDVIVRPEHQGRGVGRAMMERVMDYIASAACDGAVVGLMAAVGKEPFYAKFGFVERPNECQGAGMMQWWNIPD